MHYNKNSYLSTLLGAFLLFLVTAIQAATWEPVVFPIQDQHITGITNRGEDTIFVVTSGGKFARSFTAGKTWEVFPVTGKSLEDVSFGSRLVGTACGKNSGIYTTTDGGRTWVNRSLKDTLPALISVQMFDPLKAVTVGLSRDPEHPMVGVAYRTVDGGKTWTSLKPFGQGYGDITYVNGKAAFVSWGSLNISADSGATWISVKLPNGKPPRAVAVRGSRIIAVGNLSVIYVSNDGKQWTSGAIQPSGHFTSIVIADDTLAFVGGTAASLYHSQDGGKSWKQETVTKPFDVLDMCLAGRYVWVVGANGNIIRAKVR